MSLASQIPQPSARARIVIIEDDFDIRVSLHEFLELEGYSVQSARNGQEGLELLRSSDLPELILLDLAMPVMDGAQFLKIARTDARMTEVPIILLTAAGALRFAGVNATEVIRKPVDIDDLLRMVKKYTD